MVDLYPFNVIIYINLLIVCVSLEMVWFYWSNYMHKQFQPTNCTGRFVFLLGFYWLHSGIWTSNLNSRIIIPVTFISVCGSFEFINSTIAVMENHFGVAVWLTLFDRLFAMKWWNCASLPTFNIGLLHISQVCPRVYCFVFYCVGSVLNS